MLVGVLLLIDVNDNIFHYIIYIFFVVELNKETKYAYTKNSRIKITSAQGMCPEGMTSHYLDNPHRAN